MRGSCCPAWQEGRKRKEAPAADGTSETAPGSKHPTAGPTAAEHPAHGPATAKPQKGDSNRISLDLYKEGMPIQEIASRRKLTVSTVETHLTSFISPGR